MHCELKTVFISCPFILPLITMAFDNQLTHICTIHNELSQIVFALAFKKGTLCWFPFGNLNICTLYIWNIIKIETNLQQHTVALI